MEGTVKRVLADKGYAWVTGLDRTDYFLHSSECVGVAIHQLAVGDQLEFDSKQTEKGPRALQASRSES